MATRYILDTHALIWYLEDSPRLGINAASVLDDPDNELVLPLIALAEAVYLVERGRTGIPTPQHLLDAVRADNRVTLVPLDWDILMRTMTLTTIPEMHDRQIVATALRLRDSGTDVALVTHDRLIRQAGLVDIVW